VSFERIIGQERAKALAEAWLAARRLPHAVLVCGPEGTGKRRFALELAKAINCREAGVQACDRCPSCRKIDSLLHPDVHALLPLPPRRSKRDDARASEDMRAAVLNYIEQEGALYRSNTNIARDHLRLLQREMAYAPVEASRKIGLIFEAECMHPAGANSLLKILEEPPPKAVLILVSSAPERLLFTVLSRCQRVSLQRLSQAALKTYFQDAGLERERLELAVRLGGGSLRRAAQVAQGEFDGLRAQVESFLLGGIRREDEVYWSLLDELGARTERGQMERFLEICGVYLRDLFLIVYGREAEVVLVDRLDFLRQLRPFFQVEQLEVMAVEADRAFAYLAGNVNVNLVLADLWRHLRRCSRSDPAMASG